MIKVIVGLLFFLLLLPLSSAVNVDEQYHITLLSVSESANGTFEGDTATLLLQIRPGHGSLFLESFPHAKIDTQVATRLAQEVACSLSTADCSQYDFFYTIQADAPVIGGPSAGAATALLTLAALEDATLRNDVAMTGAISSAGVIIPVGGIREKVAAAYLNGFTTILIPFFSNATHQVLLEKNVTNHTLLYDPQPHLDVHLVRDLHEAFAVATRVPLYAPSTSFVVPKEYVSLMQGTQEQLCSRTKELFVLLNETQKNSSSGLVAQEFFNRSLRAVADERYYAAASFCYSANLRARQLQLEGFSEEILLQNMLRLQTSRDSFEEHIDSYTLTTFSELETYAIVKERLVEAETHLHNLNQTNISPALLATAIERYYSAVAWSSFFALPGKQLDLDDEKIFTACLHELRSVESRLQQVQVFLPPSYYASTLEELRQARDYVEDKEYALCLFKASKAKAEANLFLSTLMLTNASYEEAIALKQNRTAALIAGQIDRGVFPLLGYSYYEYVGQLLIEEPESAFLFAEYALSVSDLSAYFPRKSSFGVVIDIPKLIVFSLGILIGVLITSIFLGRKKPKKKSTRKRR